MAGLGGKDDNVEQLIESIRSSIDPIRDLALETRGKGRGLTQDETVRPWFERATADWCYL